jgi:hypothetical protein
MGADRAVTASTPGKADLKHFNDEIVAKMELVDEGRWILMGRVALRNGDEDSQFGTAKLVHDANVAIDKLTINVRGYATVIFFLQAGLIVSGREVVTVECNTYYGDASAGSLIAFKVDNIENQ